MKCIKVQQSKTTFLLAAVILVLAIIGFACNDSRPNKNPSLPTDSVTEVMSYAQEPGCSRLVDINGEQHQINVVVGGWGAYPYGAWIYAEINEQQGAGKEPGIAQVPVSLRDVTFTFSGLSADVTHVIAGIKDKESSELRYTEIGTYPVQDGLARIPVSYEDLISYFGRTHYSVWFQIVGGENGQGLQTGAGIEMNGQLSDGQNVVIEKDIQFGTDPGSTSAGGNSGGNGGHGGSGGLGRDVDIIFLHHSTGGRIWEGGVPGWFANYNAEHEVDYQIGERAFPGNGYPWDNYPYDYWNIWVEHAGDIPYSGQDTLEILTQQYDVIVFKHCYPVSSIAADTGYPDVSSDAKRLENYYLQYNALRAKMREFPNTRFILWTGAARVEGATNVENSTRARTFFNWVRNTWDRPGDNIYLWDFYQLETEGGLYLLNQYAVSDTDSHPNAIFSQRVAPLLSQRIVNVIEGRGDSSSLTGE